MRRADTKNPRFFYLPALAHRKKTALRAYNSKRYAAGRITFPKRSEGKVSENSRAKRVDFWNVRILPAHHRELPMRSIKN
ncbi:hypothetical protein C4580_00100 [Candidatus Woesearchaeota archaeon]|nr:MAG: hypothetical protein C4580_00100 [Candidatus Woesearchaeota archaeon]